MFNLLCLDDESPAQQANWFLPDSEIQTVRTSSLDAALATLQSTRPDCVLVTQEFPTRDRLDILEAIQRAEPRMPVLFFGAALSATEAVRLVRNGAFNCFSSHDSAETIQQSVRDAAERRRRDEKRRQSHTPPQWLMGESRAIQDNLLLIRLIGPRRCTVLITGETGTGKEMAARELHAASPRANLPMVAVNCSALPEHLLEAELFGHVKGAFTGAVSHRVGRFEQANKSTIFLDEIGEMPMELQAKLLRVLQEREIQRLGSSETVKVDIRVVAATNCDLLERVRQGKFREDLYYRLNVVPLRLPTLEERTDDIPFLVEHFVAKVCRAEGIPGKSVTPELKERLSRMRWPGNVRQLENAVEMAVAISGDREILGPADFSLTPDRPRMEVVPSPVPVMDFDESLPFDQVVNNFQLSLLRKALNKTHGNKTAAADLLGMKRTTLIMKMRGLEDASAALSAVV
jgi:DNA-binding NtrC family response regulator